MAGCRTEEHGPILKELFHTDYFKINVVSDADTVELCGSLKVCILHKHFNGTTCKSFCMLKQYLTGICDLVKGQSAGASLRAGYLANLLKGEFCLVRRSSVLIK